MTANCTKLLRKLAADAAADSYTQYPENEDDVAGFNNPYVGLEGESGVNPPISDDNVPRAASLEGAPGRGFTLPAWLDKKFAASAAGGSATGIGAYFAARALGANVATAMAIALGTGAAGAYGSGKLVDLLSASKAKK